MCGGCAHIVRSNSRRHNRSSCFYFLFENTHKSFDVLRVFLYNAGMQNAPQTPIKTPSLGAHIRAQLTPDIGPEIESVLSQYDALLHSTVEHYEQALSELRKQVQLLLRKPYTASSEKGDSPQVALFDECEVLDEGIAATAEPVDIPVVTVGEHQRRSKPRLRIPDTLPRTVVTYDLPDDEKVCPHDGAALTLIGVEAHEQLDVIPAQVFVLRHERNKYACGCCNAFVVTAKKPAQIIEKGLLAPGLLADIAVKKFADAMPLYRQVAGWQRLGVEFSDSTFANGMIHCGNETQPLVNLIQERVLASNIIHMDETVTQVLREDGRAAQSKSYMWVMGSAQHSDTPAVLFHYAPGRGGTVPTTLLAGYRGALMVDGYDGYNAVCASQGITRLGCWAHARRYLIDVQKAQPKGGLSHADEPLRWIAALYKIESDLRDLAIKRRAENLLLTADEKRAYRQRHSQPLIERLRAWIVHQKPITVPKSLLGKALHYLDAQWPALIRYIDHGDYPIDNNPAENAIRPFVVGRKNWLFSTSPKGAAASANLYSLVETAKRNQINPHAYLKHVFTYLPQAKTVEEIEALLPWNCKILLENVTS